jgi:hypothetical protein
MSRQTREILLDQRTTTDLVADSIFDTLIAIASKFLS